jgi:O-glycosyl hydrolase
MRLDFARRAAVFYPMRGSRMRRLCVLTIFAAAIIAACNTTQDATSPRRQRLQMAVVVDTDTAHLSQSNAQAIKGWGLDPGGSSNPFYTSLGVQAESLLYKMGLTFIRDQLDPDLYDTGSTVSNITLNTSELTLYESKWNVAKQRGMGYILSVWSPPAKWKTNDSLPGGRLDSLDEGNFVAFEDVVMEHLATSSPGLPVALSIQNEPDVSASYPSAQYDTALWEKTIEDTRGSFNFLNYQSIVTFGPELSALNNMTEYLGDGSFTSIDGGFFADSAVRAFATHTYGDGNWPAVQTFINSHPRDVWVTEFSKPNSQGTSALAHAIDLMGVVGSNLEIMPTNYWAWWLGFARDTTAADTNSAVLVRGNESKGTLTVSSMYYVLAKLFTTVVPGSWSFRTIDASNDKQLRYNINTQQTSTQPRIDMFAFQQSDGSHTVVVIGNWTSDDKRITVTGFPTSYKVQHGFVSDSAHTDMAMDPQDSSTCWVPTGQTNARTVLYAPHRSVLIAIMN